MFERQAHTERGSPSLVGRGIANPQEFSFRNFEIYLKAQNKRNIKQILCYAQKYVNVLETQDATPPVNLSSAAQRRHTMKALAALSKFAGCYNVWKDICVKYQLKWGNSEEENLKYFTNYLRGHGNFNEMLTWLKDALNKLPTQTGNVLLFNTLTGLRPSESILSIKLIKTDPQYANKETRMLEHFRHPDKFLRKTKKAYLTAFDDTILEIARNAANVSSWKVIRNQLNRRGLTSHLKYCRAILATYLRKCGIEQEVIDLYQGRVPTSVFRAHYLKTNIEDNRKRIIEAVKSLYAEIITCK
jgi:hypothetical protein